MFHVEDAIKGLYTSYPEPDTLPWAVQMPDCGRFQQTKTTYLPMRPVMKDESTTSNNVYILGDLYSSQFGLGPDAAIYDTQLRLIYGDLKTVKRILAVKAIRSDTAENSFDKYTWLIPGLGLWHLRFNLLKLIHTIHWGGSSPKDPTTLQYAADRWDRSRVVEPNDFQALEDLIVHSYRARVVAMWIRYGRDVGLDSDRQESTIPWLRMQDQTSWLSVVAAIRRQIHPALDSTGGDVDGPDIYGPNEQWRNHQHFCTHTETYLLLRYAIKYADIGLLRRALRECTIMFQAECSGTPNYARELLRLSHLTDSPASKAELQQAVLVNSLVNTHGKVGFSYETDRLLELLNNTLKAFQSERSYFSKNSDQLLEHWALNGPYLLELRDQMERTFGKITSGTHPSKSAAEDIFSMALQLSKKSVVQKPGPCYSAYRTVSLHRAGLEKLSANVFRYNEDIYTEDIETSGPADIQSSSIIPDSPTPDTQGTAE